ncbi:hypothetical protein BDW59DRAFT_72808 [Aspergillus cavernicola]|uniref:Uncharacterized protein n=1 Tax=Aspergillus cavernicola TaxID=176166 RepID=A0ABR4ICJ0_9EURO
MPKLAIPSPPSRLHLHPRHSSKPRCASSHIQPVARHDIPLYSKPSSNSPRVPSQFSNFTFNPKYSLTDDLAPQNQNQDHKRPDERILKLGKTLRTLSPLLPAILTNPLPPHILSPNVTLHLFPSTHPHLPTVKGRTLYRAALWAVPVAWSSVPLVGNLKLSILSERIVRAGTVQDGHLHGNTQGHGSELRGGDERLVVRWRTERAVSSSSPSKSPSSSSSSTSPSPSHCTSSNVPTTTTNIPYKDTNKPNPGTNKGLSVLLGGDAPIFKLSSEDQFTGLFIFSFDEEGRVLTQTIEHAEDASGWERTAKFVTLTDWLIGKARGSLDPSPQPEPGLVGCFQSQSRDSVWSRDCERERRVS